MEEKAAGGVELGYKFTAKELDPETNLYYYGARYYDAQLSRFISSDPYLDRYLPVTPIDEKAKKRNDKLPGHGGVFRSINLDLYRYASNNPVKFNDPDGNADILIVKDKNAQGVMDSQALTFKDGTFKGLRFKAFQAWAKVKEAFGGSVGKKDAEIFLGKADKTFNNFKTLPDSTTDFGTVASGKVYNYAINGKTQADGTRSGWLPTADSLSTYSLSDPAIGAGKVPQDPGYGNPIGQNPGDGGTHPAIVQGSHLHRAWGGYGSKGCIIQEGFDNQEGGLGYYLLNNPEEHTGKILIYR